MTRDQVEFIRSVRTAVERLFAHRQMLRHVAVRFQFWPDGLVIGASVALDADNAIALSRREIIPWKKLETLDPAELVAAANRSF
jgi:hypothetical protein